MAKDANRKMPLLNLLTVDYQKRLRITFISVNLVLVLFAAALIALVSALERLDDTVIEFLETNTDHNQDHVYLLYASAGHYIFAAVVGLFGTFYVSPHLFDSYESFLNIAFAMTAMASITPGLIRTRPSLTDLEAHFEAEVFHFLEPSHIRDIWGLQTHSWYPLQEALGCCGVNDYRDWIFSPMQNIPDSCCLKQHFNECQMFLNSTNSSDPNYVSSIVPLIYNTGCLSSLQTAVKDQKGLWIKYPLGLMLCECLLMVWASYFAHMLRIVNDSLEDINDLHRLHHQLKVIVSEKGSLTDRGTQLDLPSLFIPNLERQEQGTGVAKQITLQKSSESVPDYVYNYGRKGWPKLQLYDDESK